MVKIKYAEDCDKEFWFTLDHNIGEKEFYHKVKEKQAYILMVDDKKIGVLRYNYMWDLFPFLNQIYLDWSYHKMGYGRKLMEFWESEMRQKGYDLLMTSTQVNEEAQHFYRKLGFKDCGSMVFDIPGYEQPLEMFMVKSLKEE